MGTRIGGALPDGTPYTVIFDEPVDRTVQSISAAILMDLDDGTSRALGRTTFIVAGAIEPGLDHLGRYGIRSGQGAATISIDEAIGAQIDDLEAFLDVSIKPGNQSKLPTVELASPLRWASDNEIPLQMEVVYQGFVVRRGCGELAAACNDTGAVQVIPDDRVFSGSAGLPAEPVWIESPAPRPIDQPHYLDPGPLRIRTDHDVIWTGSEVIIWGGADGDKLPNLVDGAAWNPTTSTWRVLPAPPLDARTVTRAVWASKRMIVVAAQATLAYDPETDRWDTIGSGLYPPTIPGLMVWTGDEVAAWTESGLFVFEPDAGAWTELPDPGLGRAERYVASLHALDGSIFAVHTNEFGCGGRQVAEWTGELWRLAPLGSLRTADYADCSFANQTAVAGDRLIIWDDNTHPTLAYDPRTDQWSGVDRIPLGGAEGPSGPVQFGDGFLVPRWGEGAIYEPASGSWQKVRLPGQGRGEHMVWTGEELIMWGSACCFGDGRNEFVSMDAWRWSPPGS